MYYVIVGIETVLESIFYVLARVLRFLIYFKFKSSLPFKRYIQGGKIHTEQYGRYWYLIYPTVISIIEEP